MPLFSYNNARIKPILIADSLCFVYLHPIGNGKFYEGPQVYPVRHDELDLFSSVPGRYEDFGVTTQWQGSDRLQFLIEGRLKQRLGPPQFTVPTNTTGNTISMSSPVPTFKTPLPPQHPVQKTITNRDARNEPQGLELKRIRTETPKNETPAKRHRVASVSRTEINTLASGFRFGVATWNMHGLQKEKDQSVLVALDYETPLKKILLMKAKTEPLRATDQLLHPDFRRNLVAAYNGVVRACQQPKSQFVWEIADRFLTVTGIDAIDKCSPSGPINYLPATNANFREGPVLNEIVELLKATTPKNKSKPWVTPISKEFKKAKQALLRRASVAAMGRLFKLHKWLDAMVLQEVKYSGIAILECLAKDQFEVWRGPMLEGGGEIEYFPLLLRKGCLSLNNGGQKLTVKKIWWICTDGSTGTMADMREQRPASKPHVEWSKKKGSFRPMVVYDIEIGEGSGKIVHLGVIHTTPEAEKGGLSEQEKESIQTFTELPKGSQNRQKQVPSHEFQRLSQFSQLEQALTKVAENAYANNGETPDFFGPWILGGDYYLFRESRVLDPVTLVDIESIEQEKFTEPFDALVIAEAANRTSAYQECANWLELFRDRTKEWQKINEAVVARKISLSPGERKELLGQLHADSVSLAGILPKAESSVRAKLRSRREVWLDHAETLKGWLQLDLSDEHMAQDMLLDDTLEAACSMRYRLYRSLARHCRKCQGYVEELTSKDNDSSVDLFRVLRDQDENLMKDSLSPHASGETAAGISIDSKYDPMRNVTGLTFSKQLDHRLEITQAISGSNLDKFMHLATLRGNSDEARESFRKYARRTKVADFFINTCYNPEKNTGVNHWAASCVGMLLPKEGKMVLVDSDDLEYSKFWAGISDHFPIGAFFSTMTDPVEGDHLRTAAVRQLQGGEYFEAIGQVKAIDRKRRQAKIKELRNLAQLKINGDMITDADEALATRLNDAAQLLNSNNSGMEAMAALDEWIAAVEELMGIPKADRMDQFVFLVRDTES